MSGAAVRPEVLVVLYPLLYCRTRVRPLIFVIQAVRCEVYSTIVLVVISP